MIIIGGLYQYKTKKSSTPILVLNVEEFTFDMVKIKYLVHNKILLSNKISKISFLKWYKLNLAENV